MHYDAYSVKITLNFILLEYTKKENQGLEFMI
jgi:hypothetical protein